MWEYDFDGDANVVETYVSYLRKKIDKLGPPLIHTVRGVGYTLRLPRELMPVAARAARRSALLALAAVGLVVAGVVTYAAQRSFLLDRVDQQLHAATPPVSRAPLGRRATPAAGRPADDRAAPAAAAAVPAGRPGGRATLRGRAATRTAASR